MLGGPLDMGGAERQLLMLLPGLRQQGFEIELHCLGIAGALAPALRSRGVRVTTMPKSLGRLNGALARKLKAFAAMISVATRIVRSQPDIIHFFSPTAYAIGGYTARFIGPKIRLMSRRTTSHYLTGRPFAKWLEGTLHGHMDGVLGNSREVARDLVAEGAPHDRVGIINNGIDMAFFGDLPERDVARARLGITPDTFVILKVANLWRCKGHADLIAALAAASLEVPWHLYIVGRDEGVGRSLQEQCARKGIEEKVKFVGDCDDVRPFLAAADIGVSASHVEGFSNALLEYLAAELPVLATGLGSSVELLDDAGMIVPAADVAALSTALTDLADRHMRVRFSRKSRDRARRFSIQVCVDKHVTLYRSLMAGRGLPESIAFSADAVTQAPAMDQNR